MPGDYRIFVGAFPEGETGVRIQMLREQLDPKTASITPPHVTLAGTYWRNGLAIPENESEAIDSLSLVARVIKPFDLVVGGIHSFLPQAAVVYFGVETNDGLMAARRALLEALGGDKHGQHFTPHLTLAMRLTRVASEALLDELRASDWNKHRWVIPVRHLQLMQRGPADPVWRCISRIELA